MRGKVRKAWAFLRGARITPAHAGKSPPSVLGSSPRPDHPRTCGEKQPVHTSVQVFWITPAHAGKSSLPVPSAEFVKDHPRTCGEKHNLFLLKMCFRGSPPHLRGKGKYISSATTLSRITPALAGKRVSIFSCAVSREDHPRTCGEKIINKVWDLHPHGSPSHMRGKARG